MGHTPQPHFEKKRKRWYFTIGGKKYTRVSRVDAFALYVELIGDSLPKSSMVTVGNLIEGWLQLHPGEWFVYLLSDWLGFEGATELVNLKQNALVRYRDLLKGKGNGPQTIKHKVKHAIRVLQWAKENEHLEQLPASPRLDRVRRRSKDIPLPDLRAILNTLDTPHSRRAHRIFRFMAATGCRPKEARTARWEDIDLKRRTWRIRRTKTDHDRTVPLLADALPPLLEARREDWPKGRATGIVFRGKKGKPYSLSGLQSIAYHHGFSIYQLRHTFAQYLADTGVDSRTRAA